jgi:hypothetical protein
VFPADDPGLEGASSQLDEVVKTFQRHLYLPDPTPLLAVLGAYLANRLDGHEAVWLLLVGTGSQGKTEIVNPLVGLPNIHQVGSLTEASLLSGVSKKERTPGATSLLTRIGSFGILLAKDFGTMLTRKQEVQTQVLGVLREIYDGRWDRESGSDGGMHLVWEGKIGFIGACTPAIDAHHIAMSEMGERFIFTRMPAVDGFEQALAALRSSPNARPLLRDAVHGLLSRPPGQPHVLDDTSVRRLAALAALVAQSRTAVARDRDREIVGKPESEGPGRLTKELHALWCGLGHLGLNRERSWDVVVKVAFSSMPVVRRMVLLSVARARKPMTIPEIIGVTELGSTVVRRTVEDLHQLQVLKRYGGIAPAQVAPVARKPQAPAQKAVAKGRPPAAYGLTSGAATKWEELKVWQDFFPAV